MSEPIGCNDEQFDDLPDQDASWNKMKAMLDDEDRRRRVIPFWLRVSALAFVCLGLLVSGWYLLNNNQTKENKTAVSVSERKNPVSTIRTTTADNTTKDKTPSEGSGKSQDAKFKNGDAPQTNKQDARRALKETASDLDQEPVSITDKKISIRISDRREAVKVNTTKTKKSVVKVDRVVNTKNTAKTDDEKRVREKKQITNAVGEKPETDTEQPVTSNVAEKNKSDENAADRSKTEDAGLPVANLDRKDTIQRQGTELITDTIPAKKPAVSDSSKLKKAIAKKHVKLNWSLGLSFQEPIAIGSQGSSEYNYKGNKSWIGDHLPGLYFTAGRKKIFASGSAHYGVPQPVQPYYFTQSTKYSIASSSIDKERYLIEKIYYHQLSLTGNYQLHPKLSAGIGANYQLLAGAVTQRELHMNNVMTGATQTTFALAPVQGYKDSFLFNSTTAAVVQAEYHWKRIRLGLRYNYGLQPFIKYTLPDGEIREEKNNSLQLMVKWELWKRG